MRFLYCILSLMLVSVSVVKAQKLLKDEESFKVKSPEIMAGADTLLLFDKTSVEVGTISEDDKPSVYTFFCKNVGNGMVVVTRMSSSCGCTKAEIDKPLMFPDDKAKITLEYNPFGRPGTLYSRVLVYTDKSEELPVVSLNLNGKVTPSAKLWKSYRFTMGQLKLRRKTVDFGLIKNGQKRVEKIACANAGATDIKVMAETINLPDYVSVRTEPTVLKPSEEGYILIYVDGSKLPDSTGEEKVLKVLLKGVSCLPTERMLTVSLQY